MKRMILILDTILEIFSFIILFFSNHNSKRDFIYIIACKFERYFSEKEKSRYT